jgi:LysM repeat protein
MKSKLTIFAVVLLHAVPLALIIGCSSGTGFEDIKADTNTRRTAVVPDTVPVEATPVAATGVPVTGTADTTPYVEPVPVSRVDSSPPPPRPAPPPVTEPTGKVYYAKHGDSLSRVAKQEGISVHALASANGLPDNAGLKLRQKLIIPEKTAGGGSVVRANGGNTTAGSVQQPVSADGTRIHVVKEREVLGSIARKYGTSVAKIKELNNITDERKVRAGSKLKIPPSTKAAAPAPAPVLDAAPPAPGPVGETPLFDPIPPPPSADPSTVSASPLPAQPDEPPAPTEAIRTPATN